MRYLCLVSFKRDTETSVRYDQERTAESLLLADGAKVGELVVSIGEIVGCEVDTVVDASSKIGNVGSDVLCIVVVLPNNRTEVLLVLFPVELLELHGTVLSKLFNKSSVVSSFATELLPTGGFAWIVKPE